MHALEMAWLDLPIGEHRQGWWAWHDAQEGLRNAS
jgi:hypothetical protein